MVRTKGPVKTSSACREGLLHYKGYTIQPTVDRIPDGEPFGGMWVIGSCAFGRSTSQGYEVRFLLGDNDHFVSRDEAMVAAFNRSRQTVDRREVGALHLTLDPSPAVRR